MNNQITPIQGGKVPAKRRPNGLALILGELRSIEKTIEFVHRLPFLSFDLDNPADVEPARKRIAERRGYVEGAEYAEITAEITRATELASPEFVSRQVDWLLGAWPNVGKGDLAQVGFTIDTFVQSKAMSRYAVSAACAKLISTLRFLPTTAEVLEAISEAEDVIQYTAHRHRELAERFNNAAAELARHDECQTKLTREAEARATAQAEALRAAIIEFFPDAPPDMPFDATLQFAFGRARVPWPPSYIGKRLFIEAAEARAAALRAAVHKFFPDAPADMPFEEVLQEAILRAGLSSLPTLLAKLRLIDAAKALAAEEAKTRARVEAEARAAARADPLRAAVNKIFPDAPAGMPFEEVLQEAFRRVDMPWPPTAGARALFICRAHRLESETSASETRGDGNVRAHQE